MSITPLAAGPTALSVAPASDVGGGAADGSFAGLVAALLGQAPAGAVEPESGLRGAGEPVDDAITETDEESGDAPVDPAADATVTQVVPSGWTPALGALVPLVQPAEVARPVATDGPAMVATAAAVTGAEDGPGGAAFTPLPTPPSYDGATPPPAPVTATAPATTDVATGPASDVPTPVVDSSSTAGADAAPTAPSATPSATTPAPDPQPVAPVATPVATPSATPPAAAPAEGARPAPVVSQVLPEVTRLVSRGDGMHRLTMRLQPEGLGEVRVTLTVRDGQVDVRLTAGDDARRALIEGAPELRRVLEMTGATETRILVRDLDGSAAPGGQQGWTAQSGSQADQQDHSTTDSSGGGGDASGRDRAGTQDQHAGTRGAAEARDGHTDGATVLRPDPAGRATRAVDLTM